VEGDEEYATLVAEPRGTAPLGVAQPPAADESEPMRRIG
jgi:hypothetical protein